MNLLVYATETGEVAQHLQQVIEEIVPKKNIELFRNYRSLSYRLQQPMNGLKIAVLVADSDQDLADFLSLKELLSDIRVILVLPNPEPSIIAKAHNIGPRFMTYCDSGFEDLKAVLGKMFSSKQ